MTGIYLDTVFSSNGIRMVGLIAGFDANEPLLRQAPFDPRFANIPFVTSVIKDSLKTVSNPVVWLTNSNNDEPRCAVECLVDLVEWTMWAALEAQRTPDVIVMASHPGVIGNADVPADMALLRRADLELIVRRIFRHAPVMGIDIGNKYPAIKSIPYGVPQTLRGMIAARHLCALPDEYAGLPDGVPALFRAPSMEEIATIRHCVADVSSQPPAVLSIARAKVYFERRGRASGSVGQSIATTALDKGCTIITEGVASRNAENALRELTGQIKGVLTARHGDYEACDAVLTRLWDALLPTESIAQQVLGSEPFLFAESLIVRAHIANHRGNVGVALNALKQATKTLDRENSLRMSFLRFEVSKIGAVAAQNRWPFEINDVDEVAVMRDFTETFYEILTKENRMIEWLENAILPPDEPDPLNTNPDNRIRDPFFGGAMGTVGRGFGFLGLYGKAVECLESAAEHFVGPLDLSLNAHYLLHVELDRPGGPDSVRVNTIFNRILPVAERTAEKIAQSIRAGNLALRFTLDLLLKAMIWNVAVDGVDRTSWRDALNSCDDDGLLWILATIHSHPTELIGRHAGEFLRACGNDEEARQWFELGILVAERGGETMQRLGLFTRWLLDGHGPDVSKPVGSVLNPNFEYR
jgi:hypothetical protein